MTHIRKKLIEVGLPLEAINSAAQHEKSVPRKGHPSTMHLYWAPRPLASARAVLFAQLVDDPSSRPDEFPTPEAQDAERARLHALLAEIVKWENTHNQELLEQAREEIRKSVGDEPIRFLDPFAGGGAIPLEAQRLGLDAHGSDLNPVAVLKTMGLVDIPPRFAGLEPVHPEASPRTTSWIGAEGLAEDVRRYGAWMRDTAFERIGDRYPKVTAAGGTEHTVIAWIWARTVKSPNPQNPIETPLVRSWWLSTKKGKETYIEPSVVDGRVVYKVRKGNDGPAKASDGTMRRGSAVAVGDGTVISNDYIRAEALAGRMGVHLIAVVAEGERSRVYVDPDSVQIQASAVKRPANVPDQEIPTRNHDVDRLPMYGMPTWADAFTNRQLLALTTLSDLVEEVRERATADALAAGMGGGTHLQDGGRGAIAYGEAVATYLAFAISKLADWSSSACSWISGIEGVRDTFARQAIPMVWDFVEVNPFSKSVGHFYTHVEWVAAGVAAMPAQPDCGVGRVEQADAAARDYTGFVVSTDPPYYDNIGYADISDFFYVWLRRSLGRIHSRLLSTVLTPKVGELVANPNRHGGKDGAARFFIDGFNEVFRRIREGANPDVPLTVYYAYKQQDTRDTGTTSTGWHTLLSGLIDAGWEVTATWPVRNERTGRMISVGTNALGSNIVLACRPRPVSADATTRRAFVAALRAELPIALRSMLQGSIAPVDLAQATIGPGIGIFSRYARVRDADGSDMRVRDALLLINATLDDVLGEQESDFDPATRFAVKWYRQFGWNEASSGDADQLAQSSDTSVGALERGGIFVAKGGRARLLTPGYLSGRWNPEADAHVSIWEATVRLAGILDKSGADEVASLLPSVQTKVSLDAVKELGFLLFREAEKKADSQDAGLFNALVSVWGDVTSIARRQSLAASRGVQQAFDFDEDGD